MILVYGNSRNLIAGIIENALRKLVNICDTSTIADFLNILITHTPGEHFNPSRFDPGQQEKFNLNFIFKLLCGASKGFMKALIKPFEAPQRSVKIKILSSFLFQYYF